MTDFKTLKETFSLTEFIETGYGTGDGCKAALDAGFDSVVSIDIIEQTVDDAGDYWGDRDCGVVVILNNSYDGLSQVCQKTQGSTLFHLDAYAPGAYGYEGRADEFNAPLEMELEVIKACKDTSRDVIVIEALSIYERGCESPVEAWKWFGKTDSQFIERIFGETHDVTRHYEGKGVAVLTPKTGPENKALLSKEDFEWMKGHTGAGELSANSEGRAVILSLGPEGMKLEFPETGHGSTRESASGEGGAPIDSERAD